MQEAITAGDPDGSELIVRLTDPSDPMPPEGKGDMLPATDVQKIKDARDLLESVVGELDSRRSTIVVPPAPDGPPANAVDVPTAGAGEGPAVPVAGDAPVVEKVKVDAPDDPGAKEATG